MELKQTGNRKSPQSARKIRPCETGDLEQVTRLFQQTFPNRGRYPDDNLAEFFDQAYLNNPWIDDRFPSLVFEQNGDLEGFLGVIPRKMRFQGDLINVAVGSALMVKPDPSGNRNPLVGAGLLKQFLGGDQDLSVTDTANDVTRNIWTALGGSIAYPYSYLWTRPLQPFQTILDFKVNFSILGKLAKPGAILGDMLVKNLPPLKPAKPDCQVRDIDTADLIELIKSQPGQAIMPDYEIDSLDWLIKMAEKSEFQGPLAMREVLTAKGKTLGWYIYHRNRNGSGRVMQLAARPRAMDIVLDSLIYEASREGLVALKGRAEPNHSNLLNERYCLFQGRPWFLVHSPDPEIIEAFQGADAFFSGLDGDLWLKTNA